jgi:hypothetical protein
MEDPHLHALQTASRVVRELLADGEKPFDSLTTALVTLFPDPDLHARFAPALTHLLERIDADGNVWPATAAVDAYLPLAPERAAWLEDWDRVCAAVHVLHLLDFDQAWVHSLQHDLLRLVNGHTGAAAYFRTCARCTAFCDASFARTCDALQATFAMLKVEMGSLPTTWGPGVQGAGDAVLVATGRLPVVFTSEPDLCAVAALFGRAELLPALRARAYPWTVLAPAAAAVSGRLALLQRLVEDGCPMDAQTSACAVRGGQLDIVQWLHTHGLLIIQAVGDAAAQLGHLDIFMWATTHGYTVGEDTFNTVARHGHLAILLFLDTLNLDISAQAWRAVSYFAADFGHLPILQWLHAQGHPLEAQICAFAAKGGHLACLQWARANGCPWGERTCWCAASMGHLDVIQWARANGCPWDVNTCTQAAMGGHLEVLQWARAQGCPWDASTYHGAQAWRQDHVLVWALANGCPT